MAAALVEWYNDLLSALEEDRRAHSMEAGRKAESAAVDVPPRYGLTW